MGVLLDMVFDFRAINRMHGNEQLAMSTAPRSPSAIGATIRSWSSGAADGDNADDEFPPLPRASMCMRAHSRDAREPAGVTRIRS
jgi:hypothetical protein